MRKRRRMQSIMGVAYDPVEFDSLIIRRQHLDNLIDQELITQAAQSMGLDVDDETLAAEIRNIVEPCCYYQYTIFTNYLFARSSMIIFPNIIGN